MLHSFEMFDTPTLTDDEHQAIAAIEQQHRRLAAWLDEDRYWHGPTRSAIAAGGVRASNAIEGIQLTLDEAFDIVDGIDPTPTSKPDDVAAGVRYQRAMNYVLARTDDPDFEHSAETIKALHFMITEGDAKAEPGRWRHGPVFVGGSGGLTYTGPDRGYLPDLMDALVGELNAPPDSPLIVRAAMAHLNLVMIHPFADGNGRTSRVLQSLVLGREQPLIRALISIEEYLGTNTDSYYRVLQDVGGEHWQPHRDARLWVRFCLLAHWQQAADVLDMINRLIRVDQLVEERIEAAGLEDRAGLAIMQAVIGRRLTNASYRQAVAHSNFDEVTVQTLSRDFNGLVEHGLLKRVGTKRATHYVAGPALDDVPAPRQGTRQMPSEPMRSWLTQGHLSVGETIIGRPHADGRRLDPRE